MGGVASLQIPRGFRFADARGAQTELGQMKSAVPQNLVGILEPLSGDGYVLLGFAPIGYVKEDEASRLDADVILKTAWSRIQRQNRDRVQQGLPAILAMDWEMKPAYNASEHTWEWALRSETQDEKVISHTVRLMGRRGVLDVTAVHSDKSLQASIPLKELAQDVAFRQGESYASYQSGDKLAAAGAVELLVSDSAAPESGPHNLYAWGIGLGAVICGLATGGVMVLKKTNRRKGPHGRTSAVSGAFSTFLGAEASSEQSGNAPQMRSTFVADRSKRSVELPPVALKTSGSSGKANNNHNNHHHHGAHRRKMFDYNRYFTDLMSAVSNHGNLTETTPVNGHSAETGRMEAFSESGDSVSARPLAAFHDNSEMISQQKNLIEEQKRLIEEQSRLIEEKSRLIAEKNQFLKMQTELIDTKLI
jgi:uncharacterized membrane-anchored protein